ncbi:LysR family transcriptional regulator [Verrucomicrobiaceae bacterium N1E253]|uniref:LysR family transcriptional regulator n=1 Tax=Oceaniferula marina TaxID=2748318 RepID=A0A851GCE0_9BACT|nr:LysR substrate-binding domain-containing protein [Oceaniferula marina]NWK54602.1 LysR family transcriptional regulator [Oceaniferula marina]
MELRQLRYFVTAVELGSISKAADACRVAQPSMSQQLSVLEHTLGVRLLERSSRGVTTTEQGERILDHARMILRESENLRAKLFPDQSLQGTLRIGAIPTIAPYVITTLVSELNKQLPQIAIELVEDQTQVLVQRLGQNEISCAIVSDVHLKDRKTWSIQLKELFQEPIVLALPERHPLATRRKRPSVEEIDAEELIYLKEGHCLLDQTLKVCRVKQPGQRLKCDQLETALTMVAAGVGVAVVPKLATLRHPMQGLVIRPFSPPQPTRMVGLMRKRSSGASQLVDRLIDIMDHIDFGNVEKT